MKEYSFEKLNVWQDSRQLTKVIYSLSNKFPSDERFGLTSQLRRAMVSVCCNISEGTSRITGKEKYRYIEIAYGSLMEVLNCVILAYDFEHIDQTTYEKVREEIDKISNKLNSLGKHFKAL